MPSSNVKISKAGINIFKAPVVRAANGSMRGNYRQRQQSYGMRALNPSQEAFETAAYQSRSSIARAFIVSDNEATLYLQIRGKLMVAVMKCDMKIKSEKKSLVLETFTLKYIENGNILVAARILKRIMRARGVYTIYMRVEIQPKIIDQ